MPFPPGRVLAVAEAARLGPVKDRFDAAPHPRGGVNPCHTGSSQIVGAWTRFAKTGNPNGPSLPTWQAFTPGSGPFLEQDTPNSVETDAQYSANYKCAFWASQEASQ